MKPKRYLETNAHAWRKIRQRVLDEEPHCVQCFKEGRRTLATDVDHINGRADRREDYLRTNLQSLCASCHSKKTIAQQHSAAGRTARQRVGCDCNGFPMETKP